MKVTILPNNAQVSELDKALAVTSLGVPLLWVQTWGGEGSLKEHLEARYGFPLTEMEAGQVVEGVYKYPQDPDKYPLVKVELHGCTYYQYDYGIIAIVTEESTYITRMD